MELDLAKTEEGQDRLGKAKDRLDTRTAEIGQLILEEASEAVQQDGELQNSTPRRSGIDGNQFSRSGIGNEEADEDDVAYLFGDFDEDLNEDESLHQAPGAQTRRNEAPKKRSGQTPQTEKPNGLVPIRRATTIDRRPDARLTEHSRSSN